jgi:hypothetical protein
MKAILSVEKTFSGFPPDEQLIIAKECVVGVLRELRVASENEPARQEQFDTLCGLMQSSLRSQIELLRFKKSH